LHIATGEEDTEEERDEEELLEEDEIEDMLELIDEILEERDELLLTLLDKTELDECEDRLLLELLKELMLELEREEEDEILLPVELLIELTEDPALDMLLRDEPVELLIDDTLLPVDVTEDDALLDGGSHTCASVASSSVLNTRLYRRMSSSFPSKNPLTIT
jgi:hypothetical protein